MYIKRKKQQKLLFWRKKKKILKKITRALEIEIRTLGRQEISELVRGQFGPTVSLPCDISNYMSIPGALGSFLVAAVILVLCLPGYNLRCGED